MSTFTSSLPHDVLQRLDQVSKQLNIPKNKVIQEALELYFNQLKRAEYIRSFQQAAKDKDLLSIVEEDMAAYAEQLDDEDSAS